MSLYLLNFFATADPKWQQTFQKLYFEFIVNNWNWQDALPPLRLTKRRA